MCKTRLSYLKSIIKNLFDITTIDYSVFENTVILGKGYEISKVKCTDSYYNKYKKIINYSFNKENDESNRKKLLSNSVKLFKQYSIDVEYYFDSPYEQRLYSRWLSMQVSKMIDVIFERTSEKTSMNEDISCRFNDVIKNIRNKVSKNDIRVLMYRIARKKDIEIIYDVDYDKRDCNYVLPVFVGKNECIMQGYRYFINDIEMSFDKEYNYSLKKYRAYPYGLQMLPLDKSENFNVDDYNETCSFKVFNIKRRKYYLPLYFYFATNLSAEKEHLQLQSGQVILGYSLNLDVNVAMKIKAMKRLSEIYQFNSKEYICDTVNSIDIILDEIYTLNYREFFTGKKISNSLFDDYKNFTFILKNNGFPTEKSKEMYIYLISRVVEELSDYITYTDADSIICYNEDEVVKRHIKKICDKANSPNLSAAAKEYEEFFKTNNEDIYDFQSKVSILNQTSVFGSIIKNPYTLLENAVKDYQSRLKAKLFV